MAIMLGKLCWRYRGKNFWFCCAGHDGWGRKDKVLRKHSRRAREKDVVRAEASA